LERNLILTGFEKPVRIEVINFMLSCFYFDAPGTNNHQN